MNTEKQILSAAGVARTFLPTDAVTALEVVTALPVTTYDEAVEFCGAFYAAEKLAAGGAGTPALRDALVAAWRRLLDAAPLARSGADYVRGSAESHLGLGDDQELEDLREQVDVACGDAFWHEQCQDEWAAGY